MFKLNSSYLNRLISTSALTGALALAAVACGPADGPAQDPIITENTTETKTLALTFEGLEALGDDYVYEGWIVGPDGPVTTGRFSVDADGVLTESEFIIANDIVDTAELFVLTIEPAVNDDPAPSHVHILAGPFSDGASSLSIGHMAALGTDLLDASGAFILKTPTTGGTDSDDAQGIWWLELTATGPAPSLVLPTLPDGWVYEGWVVGADGPISTGRFRSANEADSDGAGPTAGSDGFPPFSGQDFIAPPVSLIDHKAVITVEPEPDNSPKPFTFKPLVAPSIANVGGGVLQVMENHAAATSITGSAWFKADS
jgi:hypothetical protein